jgi:hypothetical protein
MPLIKDQNLADPDAVYRAIVEAHRGLTQAQCASLDAALVLVLANHIGDAAVLGEALELVRQAVVAPARPA